MNSNQNKQLYIGNLALSVTEKILKDAFSEFGEVESVNIVKDKYSGQPRGFAFVEMRIESDAKNAMTELNGKEINGRKIKVNPAKKRQHSDGVVRGAKSNRYRW